MKRSYEKPVLRKQLYSNWAVNTASEALGMIETVKAQLLRIVLEG